MMLYLLDGFLPWCGLKIENIKEKYNKIKEIKQEKLLEYKNLKRQNVFHIILIYCYDFKFHQTPNYDILISLINKSLNNNCNTNDEVLEWNI